MVTSIGFRISLGCLLALGFILISGACVSRAGRVEVSPGARAGEAVFTYVPPDGAEAAPLDVIAVAGGPYRRLGRGSDFFESYVWYVAATRAPAPRGLTVVHFGTVPPGMAESARARPLLPGRYSVTVRAGRAEATTEFRVTAAGRIEPLPQST